MPVKFERIVVVAGHYGSGKTNLSLNLAMAFREKKEAVALADLDIVNPYFRTADFADFAKENGIDLVTSDYAGSSLDVPALSAKLDGAIGGSAQLIIDVGGDDAGALALGRYAPRIQAAGYTMLYVINAYRYLMREPEESLEMLREIEAASRLKATHIANCSNLGLKTTAAEVLKSLAYAEKVSELAGIPLALTTAHHGIAGELTEIQDIFPVEIYIKAPWDQGI